ncbi:MAG: DUF922 domain-containing protein [Mesorhizobium sp.]|nr:MULTISPECIES: DUF922 domain-containing protein [unclassified Mesorhizobium]MDG4898002.1 DUF922 domain-containing protein [Mesorhizobium sp. WSM4976]RWH71328.1 MAG: DUF922 domain-containing protein [Mesorhizobium sp.]RWL30508.1 MAG: DUF922 domain-containing protein [Mesorhizobium sp.]RWL32450.1 MAG: DUF922 domain-containing protein [Mesorhizobium sp.]RWL39164.1 MAG: DUF922 domain-containing protein [Mesorhizobium sp.]
MRLAVLTCLVMLGGLCAAAPEALAGTKVLVTTRSYDIAGPTGAALVEAMNRKGPKHGFMTRAIADTSYVVNWKLDVHRAGGVCRLQGADGTMELTYTFPRLASPPNPGLERRWRRFLAGVHSHEQQHGRIAKAMMRATDKSIAGLKLADNWFCTATHREARRRIDAVYAQYEARQNAFDAREHRDGGHVDRLVNALTGKN